MSPSEWNCERVIESIRTWHREGRMPVNVREADVEFYHAARGLFGSWLNAVNATGVNPKSCPYWTRERIVEHIRHHHSKGVPAKWIWREDTALCSVSYKFFGSWRDALVAAGLQSARQKWSKERVIRELREQYPLGGSRKRNRLLVAAAARYFGTLHEALVAAGLRQEKRESQRSRTKKQVIDGIRSRYAQGLTLSATHREDAELHRMARAKFGTWGRALAAAGFPLQRPRHWTREEVLQEIKRRDGQGLSLKCVWRDDRPLYLSARRHFGGWRNALVAAGLDVRLPRRWTNGAVVAAIHEREKQGLPLSRVWREDKPLFRAAINRFGNWGNALKAAGLDTKVRRKRWTKELVIRDLQAWYHNSSDDLRAVDPALAHAATRVFGTLETALDAAGVRTKNRRWTRRQVVETIQNRYVQGLPINAAGFGDKNLAALAKRRFGGWFQALDAAGLSSKYSGRRPARNWTKAGVLQAIQDWHAQGKPLSAVSHQDQGLYCAAKKYFRTWRNAIVTAGFKPTRQQWTSQRVIEEIRLRCARGAALTTTAVFHEDPPLAGAGTRLFGTWRGAVTAAGLEATLKKPPAKRKTA